MAHHAEDIQSDGTSTNENEIYAMEDVIVDALRQHIKQADGDELARLAGEMLGGECYNCNGQYQFIPNENYNGLLD